MKISTIELRKLRSKAMDPTKPPVIRMENAERLAKLILRRYGLPHQVYRISLEDGEIESKVKLVESKA